MGLFSVYSHDHSGPYDGGNELGPVVRIQFADGTEMTSATGDGGDSLTEEEVDDIVGNLITGGTDISTTYDDANDELVIDYTAGPHVTEEEIEDIAAGLVAGGTDISVSYDDANGELLVSYTGASGSSAHGGNYVEVTPSNNSDEVDINDAITTVEGNSGYFNPGRVHLAPGKYEINGTITGLSDVTLTGQAVTFDCKADVPIIEMAPRFHVYGQYYMLTRNAPEPRTAANILYDGTNSNFTTASPETGDIFAHIWHWGTGTFPSNEYEHAAVRLIGGTSASQQVTNNHIGYHTVDQMNCVISADAGVGGSDPTNGFLNNNYGWVQANRYKTGLHHRGVSGAKLQIRGHLQSPGAGWFAKNTGPNDKSIRFYGHCEDPQRADDDGGGVMTGPGLKLRGNSPLNGTNHTFDHGDGATFERVAYRPDLTGSPAGSVTPSAYEPGEKIETSDGYYERSIGSDATNWIELATGI